MERVAQSRVVDLKVAESARNDGFIEILDRAGHVGQRIPMSHLPLSVGRAYGNDIIVDDPYVCPRHISLRRDQNGHLIAEDLDSTNGMYCERTRRHVSHLELVAGTTLRIGRTVLRYRDSGFAVAETILDRSARSVLRILERPVALILAYLATLGILLLDKVQSNAEVYDVAELIYDLALPVGAVVLWAGAWAFANKILAHRLHFFIHSGIACLGLAALTLFQVSIDYGAFAFSADSLIGIINPLGSFLIITATLYSHLRICTHASPIRLTAGAAAFALIVVGYMLLDGFVDRKDFNPAPSYKVTLKAPVFKAAPSEPAKDFFSNTKDLRDRLKKNVRERTDAPSI